jgi:hypothetical protein
MPRRSDNAMKDHPQISTLAKQNGPNRLRQDAAEILVSATALVRI